MNSFKNRIKERRKIERAIISSIQFAWEEKAFLGSHYTEENFRYLVMYYISEIGMFGQFPNNPNDSKMLTFEYKYSDEFIPDIVCLNRRKNAKKIFVNKHNPLVVELKINASIKGEKSSIQRDLRKIKDYLHKENGNFSFEYGIVLNLGIPKSLKNNETYRKKLEKLLNENKFKIKTNSSYNLLFGWFNPITEKPEAFWLDQDSPIRLGN
ncbi:MAG: hypothetical protein RLZZ198_1815 [Bacteroidota bacterium]|jgi:hypothetical protein